MKRFPSVLLGLFALTLSLPAAPGDVDPLDPLITGGSVKATVVQPDGKILIAGSFSSVLGVPRSRIARLNQNGTLDEGFDPNPNGNIDSVVVQHDGKILIAGDFTTLQPNGAVSATARREIARVNENGTLDLSFDPNPNSRVQSMAVQADGKILLVGSFTNLQPNGAETATLRRFVARVNENGTLDSDFDPNPNNSVLCVAVQADGKILIGGTFTLVRPNGVGVATARQRVARLNANGTLDMDFDVRATNTVFSLALQADGGILLAGFFDRIDSGTFGGAARRGIARVNANGILDFSFNPNPNNAVFAVAIQADGKIVLVGSFQSLRPPGAVTTTRLRIARVNFDGSLDETFDPSPDNTVLSVALQADGKVLFGGIFENLRPNLVGSDIVRHSFARVENDPATQTLSVVDSTQVSWTRGGSSPELSQVIIENSLDGGSTWTPLGAASRVATTANWQLTGLGLTGSGQIRGRGRTTGGQFSDSSGLVEAIASYSDPFVPVPTVATITPSAGSLAGGTTVTITGTAFTGASAVRFGGVDAANFTVNGFSQITATTPPHAVGTVSVEVTTVGGTSTANALFTYIVPLTAVSLSASSIAENNLPGALVGTLSATGGEGGLSFALVAGEGGDDNASFEIDGDRLRLLSVADFETKDSYSVRLGVTDSAAQSFKRIQTIMILNANEVPTFARGSDQEMPALTRTAQTVVGWATAIDDGDSTVVQALNFNVSSDNNGLFSVQPAIAADGTLSFTPNGSAGVATVSVSLTDDASINDTPALTSAVQTFTITVAAGPDIVISGNGIRILSGDDSPSLTDHTDFGGVRRGGEVLVRTFTISNVGTGDLSIGPIDIDGPDRFDFEVTFVPPSPLGPANSTTFQVTFSPTANGLREAVLFIASSDPDEEQFTFSIQGTGISSTIEVVGNGQAIENGTPEVTDGTDFGSITVLNAKVPRVFTISNSGDTLLHLTGEPSVEITGDHAADFTVTTQPEESVAVGETTSFAVTFDPKLPGQRTALVSIANDDPNRDPFTFVVGGFGGLGRLLGQSIAFTAPGTVYLGEGPVELAAEATSGLPVTLEVTSGPGIIFGGSLFFSTGKVTVRATQPGGGNYAAARAVTRVITVKAEPSVLTLTGLSQRYDGTPKAVGTVGAAGLVEITYRRGLFGSSPPSAVGRYEVEATADGVTKKGTLVITKAPLYVVPQDKRKFAGEVNPSLTPVVYEGLMDGENESVLTRVPTLSTRATTNSPGGTYPIIARGGAAANYALIYRQGTLVVESFAAGYEALLVDGSDMPSGKLSLTVARSGRSFSGSMALAGETAALRVSGPLVTTSNTESATGAATVERNGVAYALDFTLPLDGKMTGAVTREGLALAATEGGGRLLVLPRGGKVSYSGAHTVVLEPAQPPGAGVPAGAGWARATINIRGAIALVGKLADGTVFTASLLPDGEETPSYRLWVQPYKPARVETFLSGWFAVERNLPGRGGFVAGGSSLVWFKAARVADQSYPDGFGAVSVGLTLDPWIKPTALQPLTTLLGLSGESFEVQHSATGSASDGDLPTTVTLSARNSLSLPGGTNPTEWKAKVNTSTGTFTGSFELIDAGLRRLAPFSGILRQPVDLSEQVIGDGHFLVPATPGAVEKVSGEVLFTRP